MGKMLTVCTGAGVSMSQCLHPGPSGLGMNLMWKVAAAHLNVFKKLLLHELSEDNAF